MILNGQMDLVYSVGIAMCAIMAVANLTRYKSRGAAAMAMGCACIALGFTIWMVKEHASIRWIIVGAVVTGILLVIEFGIRAARQGSRR
jgi:hypothetical protein